VERFFTSDGSSSEAARQFLRGREQRGASSPRAILLRTEDGKVVGTVRLYRGRRVLYKVADPAIHQLRQPLAWAWDSPVLDQAERFGAVDAVIRERGGTRTWTAPLSEFRTHGLEFNRGHGPQVALPLAFWRVAPPGGPAQLSLGVA
jgi:hypothetical protein